MPEAAIQETQNCPKCGSPLVGDKPCQFCEYASSIGLPEELVSKETTEAAHLDFAVLNGLINNRFLLTKALEANFDPEMLELPQSRKLARSILQLYEKDSKDAGWDKLIVQTRLKGSGLMGPANQELYGKILEVPVPSLEHLMTYLTQLKSRFALRQLKSLGDEIFRFAAWDDPPSREAIDKFVQETVEQLHGVQKLSASKKINLVRREIREILDDLDYREKHGSKEIIGYSLKPFNILNQTFSGLRRGFLYGLAGAPRRGKTNLVLDIATYCARENKVPILFFTFEQTNKNLTYRLLSKESYINPGTLQRQRILNDPIHKAKLQEGLKRMSEYQDYLYIIESTTDETLETIRGHAYNVMEEFDTPNIVIFIDYIQKMPLGREYSNEKFKVDEISTGLKRLSIELNCPVVAISSLNKEGCIIDATPGEERPTMLHCKGSGDIEYDLDVAMILSKDWGDTNELYEQLRHKADAMKKDTRRLPKVDIINLYIDKNRDAPEGSSNVIQFFFFIEENKYIELGYKLTEDVYRFKKIENLIEMLLERGLIRFHDPEPVGRGTDFDAKARQQAQRTSAPKEAQRKIRLKY